MLSLGLKFDRLLFFGVAQNKGYFWGLKNKHYFFCVNKKLALFFFWGGGGKINCRINS